MFSSEYCVAPSFVSTVPSTTAEEDGFTSSDNYNEEGDPNGPVDGSDDPTVPVLAADAGQGPLVVPFNPDDDDTPYTITITTSPDNDDTPMSIDLPQTLTNVGSIVVTDQDDNEITTVSAAI